MINLNFLKLNDKATIPSIKNPMDAGIDLHSCESGIIYPGRTSVFSTGLSFEIEWDLKPTIEEFNTPSYMQQYYDSLNRDFSYGVNHWLVENMTPFFRIVSRSGLGAKGIHVGAGIVDFEYRGEIKIVLHNINPTPFEVKEGDRIAQAFVAFTPKTTIYEVKEKELSSSNRGENGFGSSGV